MVKQIKNMLQPLGIILVLSIMAKMFGFVDASWWVVLIPLWIGIGIGIIKIIFKID